jgi:heat shock protein HslJ
MAVQASLGYIQGMNATVRGRFALALTAVAFVACLAGCSPTSNSFAGTWTAHLSDHTTLTISSDGTFTGKDGCQNIRGKGTVSGDTFTFGPVVASAMACPSAPNTPFWLGLASTAGLDGNSLTVYKRGMNLGTLHRA